MMSRVVGEPMLRLRRVTHKEDGSIVDDIDSMLVVRSIRMISSGIVGIWRYTDDPGQQRREATDVVTPLDPIHFGLYVTFRW